MIEIITLAASILCHSPSCDIGGRLWLRIGDSAAAAETYRIPNLFAPNGQMYAVKPIPAVKPMTSAWVPKAELSHQSGTAYAQTRDAYSRAVIRALQTTMPKLTNVVCRITLRLKLSPNGELSVALTKKSPDDALNQQMVSAAKRAILPKPPLGFTDADRTFIVTYVYE